MKQFFITGTDTNVGKSLVSSILMLALNAYYWKPIQSGLPFDTDHVKSLTNLPEKYFFNSSYSLQAPLSPDQAAEKENISIDLKKMILPETSQSLIVEGAGGVFVPINYTQSMLDVMKKFQLPTIIVARGTLGTINHTLLTIEMLRYHNIKIRGIIFSGELNTASQKSIEKWGKVDTLFHVPFFNNISSESVKEWTKKNKNNILDNL